MPSRSQLAFGSLFVAVAVVLGTRSTTSIMPSTQKALAAARAFNAKFSPSYLPVAVFVGGTNGIGQGMAEQFAFYTKGNAKIFIVGRNKEAAEAIISTFPTPSNPEAKHEFIPCDVTLMKNIRTASSEILSRTPKINFLVMTQGYMTTEGRIDTAEGIDKKLAVHYYSRWTFLNELIGAMRKAKDEGEDAKAFAVYSAGKATGDIDINDLGLKKSYSLTQSASQGATYNDLMMEAYAERNPDMAFSHAYPGTVKTNLTTGSESAVIRALGVGVNLVMKPWMMTRQESGDLLLSGLFRGERGAFRIDWDGSDIGKRNYYGSPEARKKLWEHSVEETRAK